MKTYNAQIEEVKDLLNNISGLAIDYDCLSGEDSMKGLIDSMADWAREALVILEKLPRDSREKEIGTTIIQQYIAACNCNSTSASPCPVHGAKK